MKFLLNKILLSRLWWLILLSLGIAIYFLSTLSYLQLDLTAENRFTLNGSTNNLLKSLDNKVEIDVLLAGDNLPAGFKKLANSTASFLERCKSINKKNIEFRFVEPQVFIEDSIQYPLNDTFKTEFLKNAGVKQNEVTKSSTKAVFNYPVALVRYNNQFTTVNLLQGQSNKGFLNPNATDAQFQVINNAEALLEYQFTNAIYSLARKNIPIVAYAVGHGEPQGPETYDVSNTLADKYRFFLYDLKNQPFISDSIKTLLIVKPRERFSDEEKLKIDQYVMRGGHVMFFLDMLHADLDSLRQTGKEFTAYNRDLNLDDLLFKYGVRINDDLVQDLQCDMLPQAVGSIGNKPQIELLPWPYFPLLYPTSDHPIVKNMDAVVMQFPQSIDTVQADGIKKTILLSTSNTSLTTGSPAIVTVEVLKELDKPSAWQKQHIPLAVLLEGKFKSLYANRINVAQLDSMKSYGVNFFSKSNSKSKIIVTSDGDWVLNTFTEKGPLPMGVNMFTQYNFANKDFLLNCLEYLTDESGILQSRSKEYVLRMLDPKKLQTQKSNWQWFNVGFPLLLILISGSIFQWRRRLHYTK